MGNKLYLVPVILCVCEACFAQAPTPEVSSAPTTSANHALQLIDGTPVHLRTDQGISSASIRVEDRVRFRVVEDVMAGNLIVIHRGAEAWGLVTAVQQRGRKGHAGTVDVEIKSAQLLTRENAALRAEQPVQGRGVSMGWEMGEGLARGGPFVLPVHGELLDRAKIRCFFGF